MKTSELTGDCLNYAVALCEQRRDDPDNLMPVEWHWADFCRVWDFGGEIIEREGIRLFQETRGLWCASIGEDGDDHWANKPLVAAMRCYVASVFGDEINVPTELTDENIKT